MLLGFQNIGGKRFYFKKTGAAGVKGAGVVMSTVLMESLGMPLSLVPILAAIWPTIDPAHTVLNNVGDLAGTVIIPNRLGKLDKDVFNS